MSKIIGLTGGIGSGKSLATEYLRSKGYPVVDADVVAREIVEPGTALLQEIFDTFSDVAAERNLTLEKEDGSLNRRAMAQLVFNDDEIMAEYQTLITETLYDEILNRVETLQKSGKYSIIFIDAALLFESGLFSVADQSWVVDVDDETRIERVMARDNATREQVLSRMASQMGRLDRLRLADAVLLNDSTPEELYSQIDFWLAKVSED